MNTQFKNIDEYINSYPSEIQRLLVQVRNTIREAAPDAEEAIKYGLATFVLNGNLVHFGAFKKHIGLYPAPSGINHFEEKLHKYKTSKGAIQFQVDEPLPLDLISEIVKFRVKENLEKSKKKKANSKK